MTPLEPFDPATPTVQPDDPRFEAKVLRAFVRCDRLVSIPSRERKRRVILRFLLDQVLPDDVPVTERDLNLRIALWHPDPSALRRYLVDAKLASREAGIYRRAVDVSSTDSGIAQASPAGAPSADAPTRVERSGPIAT